ncbi:MAG TPA: hypothetical protein DD624_00990 [Alphaproteobacteria bacterium]|nr:hypothetical protein [Alphaproteobacteria bacterium]
MVTMKKLSEKTALYEIRRARGMTQRQIAEAVGVEPDHISKLENGDRKLSPEWIDRLSKVLNCSKGELLGEAPLSDDTRAVLDMYEQLTDDQKNVIKSTLSAFLSAAGK